MSAPRYFELRLEHGIDEAGDHEPVVDYGISFETYTMKGGEVVPKGTTVNIQEAAQIGALLGRIIPDTRVLEIVDPRVADAISHDLKFVEIERPTPKALKSAVEMTHAHRQRRAGGAPKSTPTSGEEG